MSRKTVLGMLLIVFVVCLSLTVVRIEDIGLAWDNHPPNANADGPYTIYVGQGLTLDGSMSTDPDAGYGDTIVSYKWDLDNDADFNDAVGWTQITLTWSQLAAFNLSYADPLTGLPKNTIWLKVTDSMNTDGVDDTTLTILGSHDVAMTSVSPSQNEAYAGQTVNITVVLTNEGDFNESAFNVTAYYDSIQIGTLAVSNLAKGGTTALIFNWNTTGISGGYYTITANVTGVAGENDTVDNVLTNGTVKISSPVRTAEIVPCNQTGQFKNTFQRGTIAYFRVSVNSTATIPQNTLVTINLYDNASATMGVASFQGSVLPGTSTIIFGLAVPTTATIGTATVYANCYTDWPSQGGFPHCPEMSATLEITGP